jgi:Root hair defective 3 GTP-binding protein (RHD3)
MGDIEATGILNTRHAKTLAQLFRIQRHSLSTTATVQDGTTLNTPPKQTLILAVLVNDDDHAFHHLEIQQDSIDTVVNDLRQLYQTEMIGVANAKNLDDVYDIQIIPIRASSKNTTSKVSYCCCIFWISPFMFFFDENGRDEPIVQVTHFLSHSPIQILADAMSKASESSTTVESKPLSSILQDGWKRIREWNVDMGRYDIPYTVNAMTTINTASLKLTRTIRAKVSNWKSRIGRGLFIQDFGSEVATLRKRILDLYDSETRLGVGVATVAPYRYEMRQQLQQYMDTSIKQVFQGQVTNLEKATLKRFNAALLLTVDNNKNTKESAESIQGKNAATMRKEALLFETVLDDLAVPELGLTKDKAIRTLTTKLNNALNTFRDSPAAKLKRLQQVTKVVNKEKEPGQRSISFGLDLVAMLRPDGFGSLQGFAGYQLPGGNSITFGVHNDADDPQVIAQFGGVRPPLLRVQPKLRVDVEM